MLIADMRVGRRGRRRASCAVLAVVLGTGVFAGSPVEAATAPPAPAAPPSFDGALTSPVVQSADGLSVWAGVATPAGPALQQVRLAGGPPVTSVPFDEPVLSLAVSGDNSTADVLTDSGFAHYVVDLGTWEATPYPVTLISTAPEALSFDGRLLVLANNSGRIDLLRNPGPNATENVVDLGSLFEFVTDVALSPDDLFAYVAMSETSAITVVDAGSGDVVKQVPMDSVPVIFALSSDGSRLATVNADGTSSVVDLDAGRVLNTVSLPGPGNAVTLSPHADTVYVTGESPSFVASYPVWQGVVSSVLTDTPAGVAEAPDGRVWVIGADGSFTQLTAPTVQSAPQDLSVLPGEPAGFSASGGGFPAPVITWQTSTDGGISWVTDPGQVGQNVLLVGLQRATPALLIRAVLTSVGGVTVSDPATVTVHRQVTPGAPTALSAVAWPDGAAVSWQGPVDDGGPPVQRYEIVAVDGSGSPVATTQVPASAGTATLTGLTPGAPVTVQVVAVNVYGTGPAAVSAVLVPGPPAGTLVVAQFRQQGPAGPDDSFVQLTNTTSGDLSLGGATISTGDGATVQLPAVTVPAGHSWLVVGPQYSAPAPADQLAPSLGSGGLRVVTGVTTPAVSDLVGGTGSGFSVGTPLPTIAPGATADAAWVRLFPSGSLQDTADNRADFRLVTPGGGSVGGVPAAAGSATPTGSGGGGPAVAVRSAPIAPSVATSAPPNRVVAGTGTGRTLRVLRTVTNTGTTPVTDLRLAIASLSQADGAPRPDPGPQPINRADLQLISAPTPTGSVLVEGRTIPVVDLVPPVGGGLNSSLPVPVPPGGLLPGESVAVSITFRVVAGGTFWFSYVARAA